MNDSDHIMAMGFPLPIFGPEPRPSLPASSQEARREILFRTGAVEVPSIDDNAANYRSLHINGMGGVVISTRFSEARLWHKFIQRLQNETADKFFVVLSAFGDRPPPRKMKHLLAWLSPLLAVGAIPLDVREELARLADEVALYAVGQAERHSHLLTRYPHGYRTLRSRRRHEGYAKWDLEVTTT
ncbi:hypothetical protein FGRMN_1268 [Fusarium graminum]|nr:hypothetical protein FGRMN_1268 [Fusarium graminum]